MKKLAIFIFGIFLSFNAFAGDEEKSFSTNIQQIDGLHTQISYKNANAPVLITVFNEADGIVFTKQSAEATASTELDYLNLNSGTYTVLIETDGQVVTEELTIRKEEIQVQVTVLNEEDGIVYKQITTAADFRASVPVSTLESGDYLLILENDGDVVESKRVHVR